jgi:primosomal protein N' (replication factor Y)
MPNIIHVALPLPLDRTFAYLIPPGQEEFAFPGCRAQVPFGRRELTGVIVDNVSFADSSEIAKAPPHPPLDEGGISVNKYKLRQALNLPDAEPLLSEELLELTHWISQYYLCSWGEALKAALPAGNPRSLNLASRRKIRVHTALEAISSCDEALLHTPNVDQAAALQAIYKSLDIQDGRTFLLYGVTGSGKTLVYQKAIGQVLESGGTALLLIPEISLTPQMVGRFRSCFGDKVALQHSAMTAAERAEVWKGIHAGQYSIVIGARSAVFAPLANLKLIVVDEEGDYSFKQNEPNPRYHARDVALVRARMVGAATILGSATPSVESFHNAQTNRYTLLELPSRVDSVPPPIIKFSRPAVAKDRILGTELERAITGRLQRGEQIILLQNRRGFHTFALCPKCGEILRCKHCDVSMTLHRPAQLRPDLRCHLCGYRREALKECPACGGGLRYQGTGTQRVEEELARFMPLDKVIRLDLDTTGKRGSHFRILQGFAREEYSVLLGTKMVARGHDYPKVTLVGIVSADTELAFPDFRCDERAFSLYLQAAGRAGRAAENGSPGEVLIQTWLYDHPVLEFVRRGDYRAFYDREIRLRQGLNYPPLGWMVLFGFTAKKDEHALEAARNFTTFASKRFPKLEWLGPTPAYRARLKDRHRYQVVLKTPRQARMVGSTVRRGLQKIITEFREHLPASVHFFVDVDPMQII